MNKELIYKKIMNYLTEAIESGDLKVGDAVYSENRLCEKFKASRNSVRKAIREMVDKNLLISRQGVGTFVKSTGHGFINNSICMINHYARILRYDYSDTYHMEMVYGAEECVSNHKLKFQLFSGYITGKDDIPDKMTQINVDGLIIDGRYQDTDDPGMFSELSPHLVVLDGNPEESKNLEVAPDATPAFCELLEIALKRSGEICFLYEDYHALNRWRLKCFKDAVKKMKIKKKVFFLNYAENITPDNFINLDHYYLISKQLEKSLREHPQFNTIISDSDHAAIKAINYLHHKRFLVPDDIAVSGFSGMNFTTEINPTLTTIKIDAKFMAETAVNVLIDQIQGNKPDRVNLVPVRVLRRQSF